jgi:hypothetical protein
MLSEASPYGKLGNFQIKNYAGKENSKRRKERNVSAQKLILIKILD